MVQSVDANGVPIQYVYNQQGNITEEDLPDGSKETFTYNTVGEVVSATNALGSDSIEYNSTNEITKITYPNGMFLQFTYNADGQTTQLVDQTGFTVNYQYDFLGRLATLTDGAGNMIARYTYDPAGLMIRKDLGNGTFTTYGYDPGGRFTTIVNHNPDGTILSSFSYSYNAYGQPITMTTQGARQLTTTMPPVSLSRWGSRMAPRSPTNMMRTAIGVAVVDNGIATPYSTNDLNEYTSVGSLSIPMTRMAISSPRPTARGGPTIPTTRWGSWRKSFRLREPRLSSTMRWGT